MRESPWEVCEDITSLPEIGSGEPCDGECEGTGVVPIFAFDMEEPYRALWLVAQGKAPTDDGWHLVPCADCAGTGQKQLPN